MDWLLAIGIAMVAGLRSMTAPAAVSWAAHLWWPLVAASPLSFITAVAAPYVLSVLAAGELIGDKLPFTPSRLAAGPLAGRLLGGALSAAVICAATGRSMMVGAVLGLAGAYLGAHIGYRARRSLVGTGPDWPIALLEDVVAVAAAVLIVWLVSAPASVPL